VEGTSLIVALGRDTPGALVRPRHCRNGRRWRPGRSESRRSAERRSGSAWAAIAPRSFSRRRRWSRPNPFSWWPCPWSPRPMLSGVQAVSRDLTAPRASLVCPGERQRPRRAPQPPEGYRADLSPWLRIPGTSGAAAASERAFLGHEARQYGRLDHRDAGIAAHPILSVMATASLLEVDDEGTAVLIQPARTAYYSSGSVVNMSG